jgi:uncharacterized protein (TIGR03083 family)
MDAAIERSDLLTFERYLELLADDANRMVTVAELGVDVAVPPCPGWTVADAVQHTAEVYLHKVACMQLQRRPSEDEWAHEPPDGVALLDWFRDAHRTLESELTKRGPGAPSYTWWEDDQTVGFWYRRMAQETAVHRVDVESAHDAISPVDPDLAVDGIDEVLLLMLAGDWSQYDPEDWGGVSPAAGDGGTIQVRTGDHAWRVGLHADRIDVEEGVGPAETTITGEPSELLLALWGRRPLSAVRIEGDEELVTAFRDRLRLATQ